MQLKKLDKFNGRSGPLLLIVMDGMGLGEEDDTNAVHLANTPNLDRIFSTPFFTSLKAHGPAVGLPSERDMGNSEVGHNALGAGKKFDQGSKLVTKAIESGGIFKTDLWNKIEEQCIIANGTLHFIGLLSDGNIHSHIEHLFSMILYAAANGFERVRIHALLDGRDVGERTATKYIDATEMLLHKINQDYEESFYDYKIASGGGRMKVTMDRYDANWDIVKRGWDAHVLGEARAFESAKEAVTQYYSEHPYIIDQDLDAFVVVENDEPVGKILDGDSVINFNFRGDRAIEISRAFEEEDFDEFDRKYVPDVIYAGMMLYDGDLEIPKNFLVSSPEITGTIGEYLCTTGIKSFSVAETQKFGHVTYFWNGNRSGCIDESLEKYIEVPSDKVAFDTTPEMKAHEITAKTIELLKSGEYRFGRVNFANGDMVGHTGKMEATIKAVETVDICVGLLLEVVEQQAGIAIVTSDHGNADEMLTAIGDLKIPKTAHSRNPVPFVIIDPSFNNDYKLANVPSAGLTNIASTILNLLGYEAPADYDPSLIEFI
ncbi:MAG: 2,3-bisphosphoglycerate-independent phosphoglycerate mutase [Thermoplasmata archaeon]|nr:MAG: 2,3-bisphosphoglycerate-independent phosphoglycerate mutase [Thermoplasmata archaeon]